MTESPLPLLFRLPPSPELAVGRSALAASALAPPSPPSFQPRHAAFAAAFSSRCRHHQVHEEEPHTVHHSAEAEARWSAADAVKPSSPPPRSRCRPFFIVVLRRAAPHRATPPLQPPSPVAVATIGFTRRSRTPSTTRPKPKPAGAPPTPSSRAHHRLDLVAGRFSSSSFVVPPLTCRFRRCEGSRVRRKRFRRLIEDRLLQDSGSLDALVYFEIVAEVPPAAEQGKSCLSLEHVDSILQMLYCFPLNTALFYNVTMGWLQTVSAILFVPCSFVSLGYNTTRFWTRDCLDMLSSTSTQWGNHINA
ncbi:uncharacterized protein [Oryza sativa Japonica Group]|uniref:uncharacterized protein n=1 Tax=Oryza sativa subsp. japonica TaxID=39947 RepID=UPI00339CAB8D